MTSTSYRYERIIFFRHKANVPPISQFITDATQITASIDLTRRSQRPQRSFFSLSLRRKRDLLFNRSSPNGKLPPDEQNKPYEKKIFQKKKSYFSGFHRDNLLKKREMLKAFGLKQDGKPKKEKALQLIAILEDWEEG